jgi:hypothetical protein
VAYAGGKAFEQYLNKKYPQGNKNIKIHVMFFCDASRKGGRKTERGQLSTFSSWV